MSVDLLVREFTGDAGAIVSAMDEWREELRPVRQPNWFEKLFGAKPTKQDLATHVEWELQFARRSVEGIGRACKPGPSMKARVDIRGWLSARPQERLGRTTREWWESRPVEIKAKLRGGVHARITVHGTSKIKSKARRHRVDRREQTKVMTTVRLHVPEERFLVRASHQLDGGSLSFDSEVVTGGVRVNSWRAEGSIQPDDVVATLERATRMLHMKHEPATRPATEPKETEAERQRLAARLSAAKSAIYPVMLGEFAKRMADDPRDAANYLAANFGRVDYDFFKGLRSIMASQDDVPEAVRDLIDLIERQYAIYRRAMRRQLKTAIRAAKATPS